ncbi:hypothetical protein HMPREF9413_4073 [Paenibacillus sp. HGF7]|nr:hypothetical protein HMPREF9413_4073 [Paenibacillus sp. HGF7]
MQAYTQVKSCKTINYVSSKKTLELILLISLGLPRHLRDK